MSVTIRPMPKKIRSSVTKTLELETDLTYVVSISLSYNNEDTPCQPCIHGLRARFRVSTSLVPRAMTVVFGLGTRLHVRMRTRLENGVLRNGQQSGSAVNSFFDLGKLEAVKTLSGWEACTVMSIGFVLKSRWILEPFSSYRCFTSGLKKRNTYVYIYICIYTL